MGIKNQDQMTLPCFQITKTEETNDLKNVVTLEWKRYFETLPGSIRSKAHVIEFILRLADENPSLQRGEAVHGENPGPSNKAAAASG